MYSLSTSSVSILPKKRQYSTKTVIMKWVLLVFNLIFLVAGIGVIITGSIAHITYGHYLSFLQTSFASSPTLTIFGGVVMTMVAFLGCYGTAKLHFFTLLTFGALMGVLFMFLTAGGVLSYVERSLINGYLEKQMTEATFVYNTENGKKVWDFAQSQLSCCGVRSHVDWNQTGLSELPDSCCKNWSPEEIKTPVNHHCDIHPQGCFMIVKDVVEDALGSVGAMGVGIALMQLIGIFISCWMARRIRSGDI